MVLFKSVLYSFTIAVLYYLVAAGISAVLYNCLGLYLLNNYPEYFEVINVLIDVFLLLFILTVFKRHLSIVQKEKLEKKSLGSHTLSIVFLMILFSLVLEPLFCYKYIFGSSILPNVNFDINGIKLIFTCISTVVLTPLSEEFVFRHIILQKVLLENKTSLLIGLLISGIVFSLVHLNIEEPWGSFHIYIAMFMLGILYGIIYVKFGFWGAVISHSVYNLIVVMKSFGKSHYFELNSQLQFGFLYWFIIGSGLMLFIFLFNKVGLSSVFFNTTVSSSTVE